MAILSQHKHLLYGTRDLTEDTTKVTKYFTGRTLIEHVGDQIQMI